MIPSNPHLSTPSLTSGNLNRQTQPILLHPLVLRLLLRLLRIPPDRKTKLQHLLPKLILLRQLENNAEFLPRDVDDVRALVGFERVDETAVVFRGQAAGALEDEGEAKTLFGRDLGGRDGGREAGGSVIVFAVDLGEGAGS